MKVYKSHSDAALYIGKRISSKFWTGRVSDMLRHTCLVKSNDGSTALPMHTVKVDRIAKQWPLAGSISVSRDDGRKFRLRMVDKQFKVEAR